MRPLWACASMGKPQTVQARVRSPASDFTWSWQKIGQGSGMEPRTGTEDGLGLATHETRSVGVADMLGDGGLATRDGALMGGGPMAADTGHDFGHRHPTLRLWR